MKTCQNCGSEMPETAKFCGKCKTAFAAPQPQYSPPPQQYSPPPQQQYAPPPVPQSQNNFTVKTGDVIVTVLLIFIAIIFSIVGGIVTNNTIGNSAYPEYGSTLATILLIFGYATLAVNIVLAIIRAVNQKKIGLPLKENKFFLRVVTANIIVSIFLYNLMWAI